MLLEVNIEKGFPKAKGDDESGISDNILGLSHSNSTARAPSKETIHD